MQLELCCAAACDGMWEALGKVRRNARAVRSIKGAKGLT